MEDEQHVALYLQRLKIHALKFQKIQNKILEIANNVCYNSVKS
jgi:hypothetical protein